MKDLLGPLLFAFTAHGGNLVDCKKAAHEELNHAYSGKKSPEELMQSRREFLKKLKSCKEMNDLTKAKTKTHENDKIASRN